MYPQLKINKTKIKQNIKSLINKLDPSDISLMVVSKVYCAHKEINEIFFNEGIKYIADSRIENLMYEVDNVKKVLLRLPMQSELELVIDNCDISLNSELSTILKLNKLASDRNIIHNIILMFDLGDLREGIYYKDDYLDMVRQISNLTNINLTGIGTNLTCYGGIIPDQTHVRKLEDIKNNIENNTNIKLEIISGGNSSSLYLLDRDTNLKPINNLRIGESLLLGRETSYGKKLDYLNDDCFVLETEIVELKDKPSYPEGNIGMNAFGEVQEYCDKGVIKRAIVAIGKQDVDYNDLSVISKDIEIIGGSSDHLILEVKSDDYKVGSIIQFKLNYSSLLSLFTSRYVSKIITK